MTEKEKAKAYDEAIERAKKLYGNGIIEEIFPELKESKDKKIREAILKGLIDCRDAPDLGWSNFGGIHIDDCIAWLEKQGDKDKLIQELGEYKVKYTQEVLEKYINSMSNKDDERLRKNCIHFLELQKQHHAATFEIEECIDWLEKQGEQKPTLPKWKYKKDNTPLLRDSIILNKYGGVAKSPSGAIVSDAWVLDYDELAKLPKEEKIEPKFKVGDWVIFITSGSIYQVEKIENYEYTLRDIHGGSFCVSFSNEKLIREWNIQDVKDGDVLSFYSEYKGNKMVQVGIIEKYVGKHGGCSNTFKIHVGVNWDNNLQIGRYMGCSDIYPATKEQRDLLSQKIKDAGYKWNDETKALEKLEDFGKVGKSSFHEGDWVVYNNDVCQIVKREEGCNKLVTVFGIEKELVNERNLSTARLWTIQDGKDGDILFTSSSASSDTFVFKNIDEKGNAECYFAYDSEDGFTEGKYHFIGSASDCKPATKEQRDLLFQKIKETGYEWDVDKKELKKLDLVPNKKPILEGLKMKTYNDINIGDTVYIWGTSDSSVDETTITEKYDDRGHWNLKFSNGCVGRALKNGTSSTMGMYACLVYSDKEAVRESINEQIKILSNIKI